MTNTIKKLAIEAGLISAEGNGFDRTSLNLAELRFAQLIVAECVKEVYPQWMKEEGVVAFNLADAVERVSSLLE